MSGAWSYLLTIIGIAGLWAAATRPWGWLIGVSVQPLWITYALTTHQYGDRADRHMSPAHPGGDLRLDCGRGAAGSTSA